MNDVGIRIKSLRENNNLSQKQFAERIMVSQSYLSRIERGIEIPNSKLIKLIALEFNVNTDWISKGDGIPTINKTSFDYYDRAYSNEFLTGAKEDLEKLMGKISEYNTSQTSRCVSIICNGLIDLFDYNDDTLKVILGEFIGELMFGLCDQLRFFSRDIDREAFRMIKINCIDILYDQLNELESLLKNKHEW